MSDIDSLTILRDGRPDSLIERGRGYSFAKILPRIECADGFNVSVQAGELLYSTPREDHGPWSHVEVGYPSERPEPWADWEPYAEEADRPTATVYGYVPLSLVEALIAFHGGVR